MKNVFIFLMLLVIALTFHNFIVCSSFPEEKIVQVELKGEINSGTVELVNKALKLTQKFGSEFLIIEINTNGGYLASTEEIVNLILNSPIEVIAYVGPSGATAFSAGTYIALAAKEIVMEEGTVIGSAQPRDITGAKDPKVINAMAGWIRSIAEKRGRNESLAEKFVTENLDLTAKEAYSKGLIDHEVKNYSEFLKLYNFTRKEIVVLKKGFREKFISLISDPVIIGLMFSTAVLLILVGLSHPTIIEEIVAAILIILALSGLGYIGINLLAAILFLLGAATMFFELKIGHGAFAVLGAGIMLVGVFLMYQHEYFLWGEGKGTYTSGLAVLTLTISGLIGFYLHKIRQVLKYKTKYHDLRKLIGKRGIVRKEIGPLKPGVVFVDSDLWTAKSKQKIKKGEEVEVTEIEGLTLHVERVKREDKRENPQKN